MKHLHELLRIIEGGLSQDTAKLTAYAELLAKKLDEEGESAAAQRLRRAIARAPSGQLELAKLAATRRIPVDGESRFPLADESTISESEGSVVLAADARDQVEDFLRGLANIDILTSAGIPITPSLITYGPPGCGKTALARHVAWRLSLPLLTARTDSLISSYLGSTAKNLRLLFEHAASRPCVLFLDEFDALGKLRDDRNELGELKRVVISLLQSIDALNGQTVLVAATNHEHLLDPAVWRRFAYRVRVGLPDESAREQLARRSLGAFAGEKEYADAAKASAGLTGAEVEQVCLDAKREAVLSRSPRVEPADLLRRLARTHVARERQRYFLLEEDVAFVRALAPTVFTVRVLAAVFNLSLGKISKLTRGGTNAE